MERVVSVKTLPDWRLEVAFSDGTRGTVSLKDRLFGPLFEPLKDRRRSPRYASTSSA